MYKKKVTNNTAKSPKGKRAIFLSEVGKLLQPGASFALNRIGPGTQRLIDAGDLQVDEGEFKREPIFTKKMDTTPASKKPVAIEVAPPAPKQEMPPPAEPPAVEPPVALAEPSTEASDEPDASDVGEEPSNDGDTTFDETPSSKRRGRRRQS